MKNLNKMILVFFVFISELSFGLDSRFKNEVSVVVDAFKQQDKDVIARLFSYPIKRKYPIPNINNKVQFLDRFHEVFDDDIVMLIANSNLEADWKEMGWRGLSFSNGKVWLDYDGKIKAINYQTLKEKNIYEELIAQERKTLHPSIRKYQRPVLEWKTTKFHIRIDQMGSRNYRYASWSAGDRVSDKPDLILLNGKVKYIGSGGNHYYTFINGNYTYRCDVTVLGKDDSPPGILSVFKGKELVLNERVIESIGR